MIADLHVSRVWNALIGGIAIMLFAAVPRIADAIPRTATLHDLDIGWSGSTLAVSPDGKELAVEYNDHLFVLAYPTGQVISDLGNGWRPQWSPAGGSLAFYSLGADGMQLFTWKRGQPSRQLTSFPGGINPDFGSRFFGVVTAALQYSWSPDGKAIVLSSRTPVGRAIDAGEPLVLTNSTAPDLTSAGVCILPSVCPTDIRIQGRNLIEEPFDARRPLISQIFLVDVATGSCVQLTTTDRVL